MKFFLKILSIFFVTLILPLFSFAEEGNAAFSQLKPCKESGVFEKRLNTSIKKLENRLKYYSNDSQEYHLLEKKILATKKRFGRYSDSSLLCGKEGLPHIIPDGEWKHANEFVIPGLLFIYITGWIGWSSRKYIQYASTTENSFENEIIINVPIAITLMNSGFLWPIMVWKEFTKGDLLANDNDITTSPR